MRISLPITDRTVRRVEQFVDRVLKQAEAKKVPRPVLIFEFTVPPESQESALATDFRDAWKLADVLCGEKLNAAHTVAYIPGMLPGHAVLAAMACDEIMMPADAELGPVEAGAIGPAEPEVYKRIAQSRRTVPVEIALWLLNPSREVWRVETLSGREFVSPSELKDLNQDEFVKPAEKLSELIEGPPGRLTGKEARRFDCVSNMPSRPDDVAEQLGLPADVMVEDPSMTGNWRPMGVTLEGPITAARIAEAQKLIEEGTAGGANFVCLLIDSGGGSLINSVELAKTLSSLDPNEVRTVAYVPVKARSDAALIALACNQLIMGPQARLGGSGERVLPRKDIESAEETIRDDSGPWKRRSWSLVAAMIDPELKVFEYKRGGEVGYFCQEELREREQRQPGAEKWQGGVDQVTRPGRPPFDGRLAVKYGLANATVGSEAEFADYYGLDDLRFMKRPWVYFLIDALAAPGVAALLLTIAFVALYAELHTPGIGIGGFISALCFLLFFWSHCLGGTADWLEITLFLAGISFLLLEVFVLPGFGIFGLGGGLLVVISLILASQTFVFPRNDYQLDQLQRSLMTIAGAGVGIVAAGVALRRWLPRAPILSRMLLPPPEGEEAEDISRREALVDLADLVGARGTTTTQLTPSGKARFGNMLLDVLADGEVISRGTEIEVVEVHGNRVVVKAVDRG
jgi:membrane-bound serine protease (ClpP class)